MLVKYPGVAFSPWIGFGLAALLICLGVNVIRFGVGDVFSGSNPGLALRFDPGQADARVVLSQSLWLENEDKSEDAISGARQALNENPLSTTALTLLAHASERKNNEADAAALMKWASRVNQRNLDSELWLLDRDIRNGRVAEAMLRVDVLFRGQVPATFDRLVPAVAPILTAERNISGFVDLLRANPKWRSAVLVRLVENSKDVPGLARLYASLQAGENPPQPPELEPFLNRLVKEGLLDQAFLAWTKSLPADRLANLEYLYNARFQYPLTNLPFDWAFTPAEQALARAETENGRRILNVDFFGGRINFQNVSHLLALPPGSYRFSGLQRSENLRNERGLRWRLSCVGGADLGATELMTGENPWREFSVDFVVPSENCSYQKLILELPARVALEAEIIGGASYTGLDIKPK